MTVFSDAFAVYGDQCIQFIGTREDCLSFQAQSDTPSEVIPIAENVLPEEYDIDAYKLLIKNLESLITAANNDNDELIEKNSELITLITSMSRFITTHLEGR